MALSYTIPWVEHPESYESARSFAAAQGLKFNREELFFQALTHRSAVKALQVAADRELVLPWNERLEFLGDSVLNFVVTQRLFTHFPNAPEGDLSRMRAALVSESSLAEVAVRTGLHECIVVGKSEIVSGGIERPSLHADVLEAVVGAVYLDLGLECVETFIDRIFENIWQKSIAFETLQNLDFKTQFQEEIQQRMGVTPTYETFRESGPAHDRFFEVSVFVREKEWGRGSGKSLKQASQQAARAALKKLKEHIS